MAIPREVRRECEDMGLNLARHWLANAYFAQVDETFRAHLQEWVARKERRARWRGILYKATLWLLAATAAAAALIAAQPQFPGLRDSVRQAASSLRIP
jgi:hypothetical protein